MKMPTLSAQAVLFQVLLLSLLWISNSDGAVMNPKFITMQKNGIATVIDKYTYGNWCGLGHGGWKNGKMGSNSKLKCVDELDCACKRHDSCGSKPSSYNCKCDQDITNEMKYIRGLHARIISAGIKHTLCQGPVTIHYLCGSIKNFSCSICKSCSILPTRKWSAKSYLCPTKWTSLLCSKAVDVIQYHSYGNGLYYQGGSFLLLCLVNIDKRKYEKPLNFYLLLRISSLLWTVPTFV